MQGPVLPFLWSPSFALPGFVIFHFLSPLFAMPLFSHPLPLVSIFFLFASLVIFSFLFIHFIHLIINRNLKCIFFVFLISFAFLLR